MSFPLTMPERPGPSVISWIMRTVTADSVSPFTLNRQTFAWSGEAWGAVLTFPIMRVSDGLRWQAFIASLRGLEGSFYFGESLFATRQPAPLGTPEILTAVNGDTVLTGHWTADNNNLLRAGEWIQVGPKLHRILEPVASDQNGEAVLKVWPRVTAAAGTEIVWREPKGIFKLAEEAPELTWRTDRLHESFDLSIISTQHP